MGEAGFGAVLSVCALMLAVWTDARFQRYRPSSPTARIGNAIAAYGGLRLAGIGFVALATSGSTTLQLVGLFFVLLPALVYGFLSGIWLIRTLLELAAFVRR